MNKELEEKLFNINPDFFQRGDVKAPAMFFGFDCGNGWYDIIANVLNHANKRLEWDKRVIEGLTTDPEKWKIWSDSYPDRISPFDPARFEVLQVKEKFGGLRFYYRGGSKQFEGYVSAMEVMSYYFCEECGERGVLREDIGWIRTLCDEHYQAQLIERARRAEQLKTD